MGTQKQLNYSYWSEYVENNGILSAVRPLNDHNTNIGYILIFLTSSLS